MSNIPYEKRLQNVQKIKDSLPDMHLKWGIPKKGKMFQKLLHVHTITCSRNKETDKGGYWQTNGTNGEMSKCYRKKKPPIEDRTNDKNIRDNSMIRALEGK